MCVCVYLQYDTDIYPNTDESVVHMCRMSCVCVIMYLVNIKFTRGT